MTRRHFRRVAASVAVTGCLGVLLGFAWFATAALRVGLPPPHADAIVALTGGAERVETAFHLLADGYADLLLVSGVAARTALPELAERARLDPTPLTARITLGHSATSTRGNALETAAWVDQHALRSLIVVTADYHMPRALLELRRALPGVTLHPVAMHPAGIPKLALLRLLLAEYIRLLAAACGLSRVMPWQSS